MKKIALIVFLGTIAVAVGTLVLVLPDDAPADVRAARAACSDADTFRRIVQENGSAEDANRALGRAIGSAKRAAELDPRWLPLRSGLETIELSLAKDDAGAANVGLRVVDANCALARTP